MSSERFDVVVKVLNGPLEHMGEQVLRGPIVRVGAEPGPDGLALTGYRGLDKRHAVITAYDKGNASIAPVGGNQIRMAPHPHVDWHEIDPMPGPQFLSEGCAVHLGPVGRGATLEFVEVRRLGVWQQGGLASEVTGAQVASAQDLHKRQGVPYAAGGRPGAPPAAFDARKSKTIRASNIPVWFIGAMFLMAFMASFIIVAVVFIAVRDVEELGPVEAGLEDYEYADASKVNEKLLKGLDGGFQSFVMKPNADLAKKSKLSDDRAQWDDNFYRHVAASMEAHVKAWAVFRRLEAIKGDYAEVVQALRKADLPEAFAGIPYAESRYKPDLESDVCAGGYWQFMPEVAHRINVKGGIPFVVKDCKFKDADVTWNVAPNQFAPPNMVRKNAEYVSAAGCRISRCAVDDRKNLDKSTRAAIYTLKEAWDDEDFQKSGAAVQLVIATHNAGYDDGLYGVPKSSNLRPAYAKWRDKQPKDRWHLFYGENILCANQENPVDRCGGLLPAQTQHYVYTIVAQHLIAVCYYARNYPDDPVFKAWVPFTKGDGYCNTLRIPTSQEVAKRKD